MDRDEAVVPGSNSAQHEVGDIVLVRRDHITRTDEAVPPKFQSNTHKFPYRIKKHIGHNTFDSEDLTHPQRGPPFNNPQ